MKAAGVVCVIPHYGDDELLKQCFRSVKRAGIDPEHIVVVNSNPPNKRRLFTEAVNEGLRRALLSAAKAIWVLNNDAKADDLTAIQAWACFEEEGWDKCGLVGSRVLLADDPDMIAWGGSKTAWPSGQHKVGRVSKGDLSKRTREDWASFCSVFLNVDMLRDVGLLDRNLRHICSDADLCFRGRMQGWGIFYEPKSSVVHHVGTSGRGSDERLVTEAMTQDREYFREKWMVGLYARVSRRTL